MSFDLPVVTCSKDGTTHFATMADDGSMLLEDIHDIDLELALVALGAKAPPCMKLYIEYTDNPFIVLPQASLALGQIYDTDYRYFNYGIDVSLVVDFCNHVKPDAIAPARHVESGFTNLMSTARNAADRVLQAATTESLRAYTSITLRSMTPVRSLLTLISLPQHPLRHTSDMSIYEQQWQALSSNTFRYVRSIANPLRQSVYRTPLDLKDIADVCANVAGDPEVTFGKKLVDVPAMERESAWQRRQMVKGITALLDGNPWPAVES